MDETNKSTSSKNISEYNTRKQSENSVTDNNMSFFNQKNRPARIESCTEQYLREINNFKDFDNNRDPGPIS
jgi:hypothetical protein